ncbi:hypothetical protein ACFSQ3_05945 [Sphingobacterium corticis]|uniref:DUF4359 domain-containing protein n=1 Tax=Sphingobacterium corticis TaxID=1812823 RepID=A0ABW5NHW0_9SPHI
MSKTRIFALVGIVIMVVAFLTNPSRERHEEILRAKAEELLTAQLNYEQKDAVELGMMLFGNRVINEFIENNVKIDNYYLFTITRIRWENQEHTIGGGAFGMVWLSPKIDEEANKIIQTLQTL